MFSRIFRLYTVKRQKCATVYPVTNCHIPDVIMNVTSDWSTSEFTLLKLLPYVQNSICTLKGENVKKCIRKGITVSLTCTTIHRYQIFSTRYSVMRKVNTGYCGTSEIEHGLCVCTVDNPLAKARGLSLRTGAQTMLCLSLNPITRLGMLHFTYKALCEV